MLLPIGKKSSEPLTATGALRDCHARIRQFLDLAIVLSTTPGASSDEVLETAKRINKYFTQAYPLHVLDEEQSVLPRLKPMGTTVADALEVMTKEHAALEIAIEELVRGLTHLEQQVENEGRHVLLAAIASTAEKTQRLMHAHLEAEETLVFPAIERLLQDAQTELLREMRARRSPTGRV